MKSKETILLYLIKMGKHMTSISLKMQRINSHVTYVGLKPHTELFITTGPKAGKRNPIPAKLFPQQ